MPKLARVKHPTEFMRLNRIKGARTDYHTDGIGGLCNNLFLMHSKGGGLHVRLFPKFRCSVVRMFNQKLAIPMSFSRSKGLTVIQDVAGMPYFVRYPAEYFQGRDQLPNDQDCLPVGDLPYAVLGLKRGRLLVLWHTIRGRLQSLPFSVVFSKYDVC
jgi:hypothetical protein